jgi:hypothetical protein
VWRCRLTISPHFKKTFTVEKNIFQQLMPVLMHRFRAQQAIFFKDFPFKSMYLQGFANVNASNSAPILIPAKYMQI